MFHTLNKPSISRLLRFLILLLVAFPTLNADDEVRTWVLKKGDKIEAKMLSFDLAQKTIRLRKQVDHRTIELNFSELSEKDQHYIKNFKYPSSCKIKVREVYDKSVSDNKFLDIEMLNLSKSAQSYLVFVYYFSKDEESEYKMIDGFIIGGELGSMKRYKNKITSKLFAEPEPPEEGAEEEKPAPSIDGFIVVALDSVGEVKDSFYSRPTLKDFFEPEIKNFQKKLMKMVKKDTKNKFLNFIAL